MGLEWRFASDAPCLLTPSLASRSVAHSLRPSGIARVQSLEQRLPPTRARSPLGALTTGRPAVPLVASGRREGLVAARAQIARRKRAHAFWREIGRRPRGTAAHAATTYRAVGIDGIVPAI